MKRKLLITMLLALTLCFTFALCVCAAGANEFGTPETLDGIDLTGMTTDANARIVIKDGDEYHTYPAQYVVTNADTFTYDFTRIKNVNGKSYSKDNVVRVEIPAPVLVMPATGVLCSCKELVEIKFSQDSECHTLSYGCFYNNKKLETVYIPPKVQTMGTLLINSSTIKELIFMDGFSAIPPKDSFKGASGLEKLVFSNQMTTMQHSAFNSTIGEELKEVYLGSSLLDFGDVAPENGGGTSGQFPWAKFPFMMYASETLFSEIDTIERGRLTGWGGTSLPTGVLFYTGSKEQAQALIDKAQTNTPIFYGATLTEWDSNVADADYMPTKGWIIVYGYNKCRAFYGNEHDERVLNSCQFGCARECGAIEMLENPQHEYVTSVSYGGATVVDYYKSINVIEACKNCKHENANVDIDPLFSDKGYSVDLVNVGVSQSFKVNREAIELYKQYVNADFEYGVVASIDNANPLEIVDGSVKTVGKAIASGMTKTNFSILEIKVVGIPENKASASIVGCAYVFDGDKIYYLSENQTGGAATGASYEALKSDE